MLLRRAVGVAATTAVVAGTAGAVQHHQNQKYASQDAAAQAAAQPAPVAAEPVAAAPAPAQSELSAQLEELNNLKNQGILTQEEFDAKKKQLLGI